MTKTSSTGPKQAAGSKKASGDKAYVKYAQKTALKKPAPKKSSGTVTIDAKKVLPAPKATRLESPEKYSLGLNERGAAAY